MGFLSSLGSIAKAAAGPVIGSLAGGAVSYAGSKKIAREQIASQERINANNIAHQERANAKNNRLTRFIQKANAKLQKQFAQMGIRWRVKDAKASGLHPLYALGGQGASFSPSAVAIGANAPVEQAPNFVDPEGQALQNMGQNISRAIQAALDPREREQHAATMAQIAAATQRDSSMASYYDSLAAKNNQEAMAAKPIPFPDYSTSSPISGSVTPLAPYYDETVGAADRVVSSRMNAPHVGAGEHPFYREFRFSRNRKILLPFNEEGPSESIQSTPAWMWPLVIEANREYYGPNFNAELLSSLMPKGMRALLKPSVSKAITTR